VAVYECGFEAGDTDYYEEEGWAFYGSTAVTTTASEVHTTFDGNGGSRALHIDDDVASPYIGTTGRWLQFWWHPVNPSVSYLTVEFVRGGSIQATINFTTAGLVVLNRGASTVLARGTWTPGVDHWIAIEAYLQNSSGVITVYIDGSQVATYTGDTQALALADWDRFQFGDYNKNCSVDDIIVTTNSEGRLAEHIITGLVPNGDDATQLTPSTGSDNYALVDEIPQSTTDYNEATATTEQDTYDVTNLGYTPDSIHCVGLWAYAVRSGAITDAKLVVKSGTTTDLSSAHGLPADGQYAPFNNIWNTDPDTASAWTASGVNAMKAGIQFI
jgi:hypothetical protein